MLDKLFRLTQKARQDRSLEPLIRSCHQLVSERGQANVYALARQVIDGYRALPAARHEAFFAARATISPPPIWPAC